MSCVSCFDQYFISRLWEPQGKKIPFSFRTGLTRNCPDLKPLQPSWSLSVRIFSNMWKAWTTIGGGEKLMFSNKSNCQLRCTPDISHYRHYQRWCTFFKTAYFFTQRTRKGLLLAKFIQRILTLILTFFKKIPDTQSQVLNARSHVTNTPSQCIGHQVHTPTKIASKPTKTASGLDIITPCK